MRARSPCRPGEDTHCTRAVVYPRVSMALLPLSLELACADPTVASCPGGLGHVTVRLQTGSERAALVQGPRSGRVTHWGALGEASVWKQEDQKVQRKGTPLPLC